MISSLKIKKNKEQNEYTLEKISDEKLKILGMFLKYEVSFRSDYVKKEILDEDFFSFNSTAVEREGDKIRVLDLYDDDEEYVFYMDYDNFMEILDTWKILYEQRVDEMVLTMDENYHCELKAK